MKFQSKVKLILGVFLLLLNNNGVWAQTNTDSPKQEVTKVDETLQVVRETRLNQNPSWQRLKEIWKKFLHIESDPDYIEYNKLYKKKKRNNQVFEVIFHKYRGKSMEFETLLNNINSKGLISSDEKEFLSRIYLKRLDTYFPMAGVSCYLYGNTGAFATIDLGKRLEIIEKMYNENKINQETYDKTIKAIKTNLDSIEAGNADMFILRMNYDKYLKDMYKSQNKDVSVSCEDFIKNNADKILSFDDYVKTKSPDKDISSKVNLLINLSK